MLSVSVDRTDLGLAALVFDDPASGLWVPEDGLVWPEKRWTRTSVSGPFVHGSVQTRATLEQATMQLTVYVSAATSAALRTLQAEVEAAFFQWVFDVTITEDGQATTCTADCADVSWGPFDSGMTRAHLARATVTAPVYPVGV